MLTRDPARIDGIIEALRRASSAQAGLPLCGIVWEAIRVPGMDGALAAFLDSGLSDALRSSFGPSASSGSGREALLDDLAAAWRHVPHWRLCQLLVNLAGLRDSPEAFYVEDDHFLARLEERVLGAKRKAT